MSSLKVTLSGYAGYRGREGQLSFLLHRLSGLGTLLFLAVHILDTSTVYFFPNLYAHAIDLYRTTLAGAGEIMLMAAVIFHGLNGIRIAFFDWKPQMWSIETERKSVILVILISFLLWLFPAYLMGRNMLIFNFGLLGGG